MTKATLAVLSIVLFFVLYIALVIALGYLVYFSVIYSMDSINRLSLLMKGGAIAGSIMLFVFTLKFVFKLKNHQPTNRIRLKSSEHPELWNFVERICQETGAPRPKNIYVDPDVNAYVAYSNNWLSLFLPVQKELTIGLGLVSCLSLSEFKAVIAHEFGHFAQSSMKIGSYIMSANTIIHDMIYSRDRWDDLLDKWRGSDIRLSAAAWLITPVIWLIRMVLSLFYKFLNVMYSSLSREMEFNADKVAVSTTGSDAIVSALWKLDSGSEHWNNTINHAYLAAQKKLHTKNLYKHNLNAIIAAQPDLKSKINSLPEDERGGKQYFSVSHASKTPMYASHPPNDHREANAKVPYVPCPSDERSPWILFGNQADVQEQMTALVYKDYLNKVTETYTSDETFIEFIRAEQSHKTLLDEFDNTFENRFFVIPDDESLNVVGDINTASIDLLKSKLTVLMKPIRDIETLMVQASQIAQGTSNQKSLIFQDRTYDEKKMEEAYNLMASVREKHFSESFVDWDSDFCIWHMAAARQIEKDTYLAQLFLQHKTITEIYRAVIAVKSYVYEQLHTLQSKDEVANIEIARTGRDIVDAVYGLNSSISKLDGITFIPLPNIDSLSELKAVIVEGGVFEKMIGPIFENGNIDTLLSLIETTLSHCQRLDQKSIGFILKVCQEIRAELKV